MISKLVKTALLVFVSSVAFYQIGQAFQLEPMPTYLQAAMSPGELREFMEEREFFEYDFPVFMLRAILVGVHLAILGRIWKD